MRHPERLEDYLGHVAQAIERARSYVQPLPDLHAFEQNPLVQDAVVRNIEIAGDLVAFEPPDAVLGADRARIILSFDGQGAGGRRMPAGRARPVRLRRRSSSARHAPI